MMGGLLELLGEKLANKKIKRNQRHDPRFPEIRRGLADALELGPGATLEHVKICSFPRVDCFILFTVKSEAD